MQLAILCGETGDLDAAFRQSGRALESHDPGSFISRWGRNGTACGADPRYALALQKMNLS
jgi:hypothetical protein